MKNLVHSLRKHGKLIFQIFFGLLSLMAGIYFIKHESAELIQVKSALQEANSWLLAGGGMLVLLFILVQGLMYQYSFRAVEKRIPIQAAVLLYLKRNFISVFLPAGMVTNILFFNREIEEKQGIDKTFIYYASTIFSVCSFASSILIAIPAIILLFLDNDLQGNSIVLITIVALILAILSFVVVSIIKRGFVFRLFQSAAPGLAKMFVDLQHYPLKRADLVVVLGLSCIIELIGVAHLYIAMAALDVTPSLPVAIIGYSLVLIILLTSPFLRGIGAIELALTYALTLFGFSAVAALSVAFLFRFFEFWSTLLLGIIALLFRKDGLFLQMLAPVLLFFLGIVNIFSGLTPALTGRVKVLRDFIPYDIIEGSNTLVIVIGIVLVFTAVTLVQAYRNSYYLALFLAMLSFIGHLFKGIDYEEAALALFTMGILIYQRKDYFIRSVPLKLPKRTLALGFVISVVLYGIGGFYILDFRQFNTNFTLWLSVVSTIKSVFLLNIDLNPLTPFGRYFLLSLRMLGISSLLYFLWQWFRPVMSKPDTDTSRFARARQMVADFGNSPLDYFKTYFDKQLYFFENEKGFISYKTTKRYAMVLENPVCSDHSTESMARCIKEFEAFALARNKNTIYYRIPEASKPLYEALGKKLLLIGEDAFVDLKDFTLQGGEAKPLRNAMNKLQKSGYYLQNP